MEKSKKRRFDPQQVLHYMKQDSLLLPKQLVLQGMVLNEKSSDRDTSWHFTKYVKEAMVT